MRVFFKSAEDTGNDDIDDDIDSLNIPNDLEIDASYSSVSDVSEHFDICKCARRLFSIFQLSINIQLICFSKL